MVRKTAKERLHQRDSRARSELLDGLFEPWIAGARKPALRDRLGGIDPRDAPAVEGALRDDILPVFQGMTLETQGRIRDAMTVFTRGGAEEFQTYWLELEAPFGADEGEADAILKVLSPLLGVRLPEGR